MRWLIWPFFRNFVSTRNRESFNRGKHRLIEESSRGRACQCEDGISFSRYKRGGNIVSHHPTLIGISKPAEGHWTCYLCKYAPSHTAIGGRNKSDVEITS